MDLLTQKRGQFKKYGASISSATDMDSDINKNDVFILSYNFDWEYAFLKVHTFSGVYVSDNDLYLFNEDTNTSKSTETITIDDITNTNDSIFRVGYILK